MLPISFATRVISDNAAMEVHIPTLFLVIIATGAALAGSNAFVAWGRDRALLLWALALALHTSAYVLFSLRGQINDMASIVLANVALSSTFALFAESIYQFQKRQAPHWLIWLPVGVVAVGFYLLIDSLSDRIIFGGVVMSGQAFGILVALAQKRSQTTGRGKYILAVGATFAGIAFAWRAIATGTGAVEMSRLTAANAVQTSTFMLALICQVLLAFGLVIMTKERAEKESRKAEQYERVRSQAMELLAKDAPLPEILYALVRGLEQLNPAAFCSILLLDESGLHLTKGMAPSLPDFYNTAIDGIAIGVGVGSCGTAAFTGERVVVTDIATHPFWAPYKELAARAGLGACWSQPIRASTGDILGTFAIYHRDATAPAETDVHLIEQFARLASVAIERDKTAEKIRASVAHYRLLTEGVSDVVWKLDLAFRFTYMSPADERMRGYRADEVLGRHVYELFTQDGVAHVKQQLRDRDLAEKKGGIRQDAITFEVQQHCKDGSLVWTEIISTRERDADDRVIGLHGITRNITDRRQAQEQMHQLAFYDTLTHLANRRLLHDRLSQAMVRAGREQSRLALLFIDLDEFKPINDAHGHDVGDWVLHSVARRIEDCLRASDTAARIGGDEFVVLLPDMQSTADALAVAEKIRSSLQLPLETGKVRLNPTASIGVAAYPDHGNTEQDLLRLGDDAMYVAKKAGGNRVEMCAPGQAFSSSISSMVLPARLQPSSTAT